MIEAVAQDGLLAYTLPNQTREKLSQIERITDIFCIAMKGKWDRLVYADMLSGPGICVDTLTGEERRGSALIAAKRPEFSRLFINDANDRATEALRLRLRDEPEGRVLIRTDDCNAAVEAAREFLFPPRARKTLGLAVIDPSAYQMSFDSIARLTEDVRLDLMIVLMTSFMRRFLTTPSFNESMSRMLGADEVDRLIRRRLANEPLTFGDFLAGFRRQLSLIGYDHVEHSAATNSRGGTVYHVVYASRHRLGREFYAKASAKRDTGQIVMPLPMRDS